MHILTSSSQQPHKEEVLTSWVRTKRLTRSTLFLPAFYNCLQFSGQELCEQWNQLEQEGLTQVQSRKARHSVGALSGDVGGRRLFKMAECWLERSMAGGSPGEWTEQ